MAHEPGFEPTELETVLRALSASRKYADVAPATLVRVASWALARRAGSKADTRAATKAAKRKLHQTVGAYPAGDLARLRSRLEAVELHRECDHDPDRDHPADLLSRRDRDLRPLCLEILRAHRSSAERIPILAELYPALFSLTGRPRRVLDLAGGLHPFALPWMDLAPDCEYLHTDVDLRVVALVATLLAKLARPGSSRAADLLVAPPAERADVAFLLKTLPSLEQQEPGSAARILASIPARWIVVSFPTRSLGGRGKGMERHYGGLMARWLAQLGREATELRFPSELVYVVPGVCDREERGEGAAPIMPR